MRRPLLGSFEENVLNQRLQPVQTVDGYLVDIRAVSSTGSVPFQPKPLTSAVQVSFYSAGDSSFPYLGLIHIGQRGYRIPKKGTLQVTLFNPLGTIVHLFVLIYDLSDMPANSQTLLRQKTVFQTNHDQNKSPTFPDQLRYLIQLNIVSSKANRVYLNKDLRIYVAKKADLDTATQLLKPEAHIERSYHEMPINPTYFSK